MADAPKQLIAVQGIDEGVEASVNHSPEVHELIDKAKQELANWLPQWGEKPVSTSQTQEVAHELREENLELVRDYIPPEHLFNEKERIRNLMHIREFCRKLHNILGFAADGGSRIFINDPPRHPAIDENLKGLFVKMRGMDMFTFHTDLPPGWKKICAIQTPYMSEWGIFHRDSHGAISGFKYIGWRGQVLLRLILAGAITEEEAHKEFGTPQGVEVDQEYFNRLREFREYGKRTAN